MKSRGRAVKGHALALSLCLALTLSLLPGLTPVARAEGEPAPPDAPTGLTLTPGDTQVVADWTTPDDGGSPITGYEYSLSEDRDDDWEEIEASDAETESHTFEGLENGTPFTVRIRAINVAGAGEPTEPKTATPNPALTGTVTILGDAVYGSDLTATPPAEILSPGTWTYTWTRTWTPPESEQVVQEIGGANDATYTLTKDDIGKTIGVVVSAENYTETAAASMEAPVAPKELTISGISFKNKVYDGYREAELDEPAPTLQGVVDGDEVTLGEMPSYLFADAAVGTHTVTPEESYELAGDDAEYYTLKQPEGSFSATITQATPTVVLEANGFAEDQNAFRPQASIALEATLPEDATGTVTFRCGSNIIGEPQEMNFGAATTTFTPWAQEDYSFTAVYSGDNNYTVATSAPLSYTLTKGDQAAISIDGLSGPYTYGAEDFSISYSGGDGTGAVTYAVTQGVGVASVDESTGVVSILKAGEFAITATKEGDDDYNQASVTSDLITVNKQSLSISGATIAAKSYDATTAATVTNVTLSGEVNGDSLTLGTDYTVAGEFDSEDVGDGKTVTVTVTLASTTTANNYTMGEPYSLINQSITVGVIDAAPIAGVTSPARGGTPSTAITDAEGYTAALSWDDDPEQFESGKKYRATITLTAKANYQFSGAFVDKASIAGFTVNGKSPTEFVSLNDGKTELVFKVEFSVSASSSGSGSTGGGTTTPTTPTTPPASVPGGGTVETPAEAPPVSNSDGTVALPGGGTIKQPDGDTVEAPPDTVVEGDGTLHIPVGEEAVIVHPDGTTQRVPGGYDIHPDGSVNWRNPFVDVKKDAWYYSDIEYVYTRGLMSGTSQSQSSPNAELTRGMIVTILYRHFGEPGAPADGASFADVPDGEYFTDAVKWSASSGIVRGVGGGQYAPDESVIRQDLAVLLMRYAQVAKLTLPMKRSARSIPLADEGSVSEYAKTAVETMFRAGVVNGKSGGVFAPRDKATRAEVAAMLHRFLENAKPAS